MFDWGEPGRQLIDYIPFVSLAVKNPDRPLLTRLAEQSAIGVAAALAAIYVNDKVQDHDMQQLTAEVRRLADRVDQLQRDLYLPKLERAAPQK